MIPAAKPLLGESEAKAVAEVIKSGMLAQGKKVAEFEEKFGMFIGAKHAMAVGNGTQALHVALLAAGVKRGDEVITTAFSFLASSTSIVHCGAKPVFCDIDPNTFNIDPDDVRKMITKKTKAIMPVHLFGLSSDVKELQNICDEHDLVMVVVLLKCGIRCHHTPQVDLLRVHGPLVDLCDERRALFQSLYARRTHAFSLGHVPEPALARICPSLGRQELGQRSLVETAASWRLDPCPSQLLHHLLHAHATRLHVLDELQILGTYRGGVLRRRQSQCLVLQARRQAHLRDQRVLFERQTR